MVRIPPHPALTFFSFFQICDITPPYLIPLQHFRLKKRKFFLYLNLIIITRKKERKRIYVKMLHVLFLGGDQLLLPFEFSIKNV